MSEREIERLRLIAWNKSAKGHGLRWKMLRDLMAIVSLAWMDTFLAQVTMRRLWGLKNRTTRDMLEELEAENSVKQELDDKMKVFKWGATQTGVDYWLKHKTAIPAGIVEVVSTTSSVLASEEKKGN